MNSTTQYTFTITERDGRFYFLRDGMPCGAKYGYDSRSDVEEAIAQTQRWDRIAG